MVRRDGQCFRRPGSKRGGNGEKSFRDKMGHFTGFEHELPRFPGAKGTFSGCIGLLLGRRWDKLGQSETFRDILGTFSRGSHEGGIRDTGGESVKWGNGVAFTGDDLRRGVPGPYIKVMPGRSGCQRRGVSGAGFHFRWRRSTATGAWIPASAGKTGEKRGRELRRPPREDHPDWKAAVSVVEPARMESASAREWRNEAVYRNLRQPALLPPATR